MPMTDIPWLEWYQSLAKPTWTSSPRTSGLIWLVLSTGSRAAARWLKRRTPDQALTASLLAGALR